MKYINYAISIICLTVVLSACGRKQVTSENQPDNAYKMASDYLQPMVHIGDSRSNLISKFGQPFMEYTTELHQVSITFNFSLRDKAAMASHAAGFTVFCTSNVVTSWAPVTISP